ncbi:hypothetical protein T484DRAFT_1825065, partial [Baffinella frigidus]
DAAQAGPPDENVPRWRAAYRLSLERAEQDGGGAPASAALRTCSRRSSGSRKGSEPSAQAATSPSRHSPAVSREANLLRSVGVSSTGEQGRRRASPRASGELGRRASPGGQSEHRRRPSPGLELGRRMSPGGEVELGRRTSPRNRVVSSRGSSRDKQRDQEGELRRERNGSAGEGRDDIRTPRLGRGDVAASANSQRAVAPARSGARSDADEVSLPPP